jgi:hypothetical protein
VDGESSEARAFGDARKLCGKQDVCELAPRVGLKALLTDRPPIEIEVLHGARRSQVTPYMPDAREDDDARIARRARRREQRRQQEAREEVVRKVVFTGALLAPRGSDADADVLGRGFFVVPPLTKGAEALSGEIQLKRPSAP